MARRKKAPSKVVDYNSLSDELKDLYDKYYQTYDEFNIYDLREEAVKLHIESPTTLKKADLVKRIVDKVISEYLPGIAVFKPQPWSVTRLGEETGELIEGVFENDGTSYRIGKIVVPVALVKEFHLRNGDLVKGRVTDLKDQRTLASVEGIEGGQACLRPQFEEIPIVGRRSLTINNGSFANEKLPSFQAGERVIYESMTFDEGLKLCRSFPCAVGLFLGVVPEHESRVDRTCFKVPFDHSVDETNKVARLALERAKRLSERGNDVVLVIYGFDMLSDQDTKRALFGVGRCLNSGSITVIADITAESQNLIFGKIATRIVKD